MKVKKEEVKKENVCFIISAQAGFPLCAAVDWLRAIFALDLSLVSTGSVPVRRLNTPV